MIPRASASFPTARLIPTTKRGKRRTIAWERTGAAAAGCAVASCLWLVGGFAGCAKPERPTMDMWVSPDRYGAPRAEELEERDAFYHPADRTVFLRGSLNEVLGFRWTIGATGKVDVRVGPFVGNEGRRISGNLDLYRMHFVRVASWPGWHLRRIAPSRREALVPDVLVPVSAPVGGLPAEVAANRLLDLWVDVRIPKGTPPGRYSAVLSVEVDGAVLDELTVVLRVWPLVLPEVAGPEMIVEVDQRALFEHHIERNGAPYGPSRVLDGDPLAARLEGVLASTMRLLHDHRVSPHLPGLHPLLKITADGQAVVDWTDYDRVVSGFVEGSAYADRLPSRSWPIPFDPSFPPAPAYGGMVSPTYSRLLREYLRAAAAHYEDRGWLTKSYLRLPGEAFDYAQAAPAVRHYGSIVHLADPRLRVLTELFPQDMAAFGWYGFKREAFQDAVDVWAPPGQFFDPSAIAGEVESTMWLTAGRPPFSGTTYVGAPAVDCRVLPWQGYLAGAEAVRLGAANDWPAAGNEEIHPQDCVDRDPRVLLYPGRAFGLSEPVPSLRLKRLRRGMQDVAYETLLEARGLEHIARTLGRALVVRFGADAYGVDFADGRLGSWVQNPRWWEQARRIAADALLSGLGSEPPGGLGAVPATIRWRRFMDATHGVDLKVAGVRVRPAGVDLAEGFEVECVVTVTNRRRTPVTGQLSLVDLPQGWRGTPATRRIRRLAPNETGNAILGARMGSLTWDENGVLRLPLLFEEEGQPPRRLEARLCHVTAQSLHGSIRVDGDLRDWPTGVGNYASGFQLLCGNGGQLREEPPKHDTLCFVGRVDDRLYFGLRCAGAASKGFAGRGGAVVPDDLVLCDGESVEILLDPANAGTRSPADLYRVVVRSNGAYWERGVGTNPPTGPVTPWPAAVRVATRRYADHWVAEVEIPLEAFPERYRGGGTWGLNITRFDAADQEASNWSGAMGNVYDPLSLGNMTVP